MGIIKAVTSPKLICAFCVAGMLAGCGDDEVILAGERLSARAVTAYPDAIDLNAPVGAGEINASFSAPEQTRNENWTHRAGNATHHISNPAVSATPSLV